jgi:hypothetical protein
MAVDIQGFVGSFPEFKAIASRLPEQVQAKLDAAKGHVSAVRFGARYEHAVFLKAAHMLAMSPFGEAAKLKPNASTSYSALFDDEIAALPVRMLVIC